MGLSWSQHMFFGVADKVGAFFLKAEPVHWLTIGSTSSPIGLYEIAGNIYVVDLQLPKGWRRPGTSRGWGWASDPAKGLIGRIRVHGGGTLTTAGVDTEVTLTEVTDFVVKHRVVIAYAAEAGKSSITIAFGEDRHQKHPSSLVHLGLAPDDTPEGLAAAVPYFAIFELTPA